MALVHRRLHRLTKLAYIILLLLFLKLILIYFIRQAVGRTYLEEANLTLLNQSSTDYQFIETNFLSASEGSWQYISDSTEADNKFLAFSAFLDDRFQDRFVRIIAVGKSRRNFRREIWCKFWFKESNGNLSNYYTITKQSGDITIIQEHWSLPYSAQYVRCPIDNNLPVPDAVSLLTTYEGIPNNLLKVKANFEKPAEWDIFKVSSIFNNLAICVKPLHYDYNDVLEFIQFMELHHIMGVNNFFFYNHTVGSQVDCLLRNYIKEGTVTLLPWQLPLTSQKEIRTEGIFAALNDCLFRTMHLYTHTMFIDFDEYILPRNNYTYMEFFKHLNAKNDMETKAAFIFQNAFFYRQWANDIEVNHFNDPLAANLLILKKTRRKKALHPHRTRSKYIVKPELISTVGNHFIWEYANRRFRSMNIKPDDAILHHYRVCEFGGDDCISQESVVDRTAYKYKDELVRAVRSRIEKHRTECQLDKFMYNNVN